MKLTQLFETSAILSSAGRGLSLLYHAISSDNKNAKKKTEVTEGSLN